MCFIFRFHVRFSLSLFLPAPPRFGKWFKCCFFFIHCSDKFSVDSFCSAIPIVWMLAATKAYKILYWIIGRHGCRSWTKLNHDERRNECEKEENDLLHMYPKLPGRFCTKDRLFCSARLFVPSDMSSQSNAWRSYVIWLFVDGIRCRTHLCDQMLREM